jgi:hypothetical protein
MTLIGFALPGQISRRTPLTEVSSVGCVCAKTRRLIVRWPWVFLNRPDFSGRFKYPAFSILMIAISSGRRRTG